MKKAILALALSSVIAAPALQAQEITTEEQKLSYGLGLVLGQRLKTDFDQLDFELLKQGIEVVFSGGEPLMSQQAVAETLQAFQMKKVEEQQQAQAALAAENKEKGDQYRAENGNKAGVLTTESGLQIETLAEGEGANPTAEDSVRVHYRGTLIDGQEFDSSYGRGEPVTFPLQGVIKGWTEGLQLMKKGGKARLVIPAELAYGPGGAGEMIGPNATLVFEVELLDINPEE